MCMIHTALVLNQFGLSQYLVIPLSGLDEKDKLSRQKQLLNKRLGLDVAGGLGVCADDLYQEEDLVIKREIDTLADQQVIMRHRHIYSSILSTTFWHYIIE